MLANQSPACVVESAKNHREISFSEEIFEFERFRVNEKKKKSIFIDLLLFFIKKYTKTTCHSFSPSSCLINYQDGESLARKIRSMKSVSSKP